MGWIANIQPEILETTFSFHKFWAVPCRFRVPLMSVNHVVLNRSFRNRDGTGNEKSFPLSLHPHPYIINPQILFHYCVKSLLSSVQFQFKSIFIVFQHFLTTYTGTINNVIVTGINRVISNNNLVSALIYGQTVILHTVPLNYVILILS